MKQKFDDAYVCIMILGDIKKKLVRKVVSKLKALAYLLEVNWIIYVFTSARIRGLLWEVYKNIKRL